MARDSSEVRVAASGDIYVGPFGTALPEDIATALNPALTNLGYATDDGVTATAGVDVEDIPVWQRHTPARRIVTARSYRLGFQLAQWNPDNFALAFGGGDWTEPTAGVFRYDPPADQDDLPEYSAVVEWQDGDHQHRIVVIRATMTEEVETQLVRNAAAVLPVVLNALTPDDEDSPWYHLTDDAAFIGS